MKFANMFRYVIDGKPSRILRNPNVVKPAVVFIFIAIIATTLFSATNPQQVSLRLDEVAKRNIVSETNAVVVDEKRTAELREEAAAKVQKSYQEDREALNSARAQVNGVYDDFKAVLASPESDKRTPIRGQLEELVSRNEAKGGYNLTTLTNYLLTASPEDLEKMRQASLGILDNVMSKPITQEALPGIYTEVSGEAGKIAFNAAAVEIVQIITIDAVRPNLIYNRQATELAIEQARNAVEPVRKNVLAGEVIVREGDRVTAEQISVLEQLGIQRTENYSLVLVGLAGFVLLTIWLVREYLKRYHRDVLQNDKLLLLLGLIVVLVVLLARALIAVQIADRPEINAMAGYLAPVAFGSMLVAILIDNRLAYFITMILALFVGLLTESNQLALITVAFVGGTVGAYRVTRLSQTGDLARAGFYIAIANAAAILAMELITGSVNISAVLVGILLGVISGILSAVLTIGALPYLESAFSITSMIKLLELSNPNHELLKRLLIEAPGTYHHSLMVGNLAEASAQAVGANPLLVRVGAYFHDIGKIKRPEYFVENQRGFDEPHNKIAPALSALIIISHVKEGVELAREARLPEVLIDFIASHHGTSLAKYFYTQAIAEEGEGMVNEDSFRYEGPKPQTKEVALVMLADAVEAAVRSLPNPNMDSIRIMVNKIIRDKLNDHQLDECDLTFKDLDILGDSFCNVLGGVHHKRIEYPDIVQEFTIRRAPRGNDDNQPADQSGI